MRGGESQRGVWCRPRLRGADAVLPVVLLALESDVVEERNVPLSHAGARRGEKTICQASLDDKFRASDVF